MHSCVRSFAATPGSLRLLLLVLGFSTLAYVVKNQFVSFDFPSSTDMEAMAITPPGGIVGHYVNSDGRQHGFVLSYGVLHSLVPALRPRQSCSNPEQPCLGVSPRKANFIYTGVQR